MLKTLTKKKAIDVPPEQDYRYMLNIVSSTCRFMPVEETGVDTEVAWFLHLHRCYCEYTVS